MPIRVLHVLGSLNRGGVETWLMNLLRYIDRSRIAMDFCVHTNHEAAHDSTVLSLGAKIHHCPYTSQPLLYRSKFGRILSNSHYDVVHSHVHHNSGFVLRIAAKHGVPVRIAHSHTSVPVEGLTTRRKTYEKVMKHWINKYSTHRLAASSVAAANLFGPNWHSDPKCRVIHYGIDFGEFSPNWKKEDVRWELHVPLNTRILGYAARFVEWKNHTFLIEIAMKLLENGYDCHVLLIGDGPTRSAVKKFVKHMDLQDYVTFAGERADVPRCMAALDLFVFPSRFEGLGIVALEALASGIPVLASTAVPRDIDLFPGMVEFLDVGRGPSAWAQKTVDLISRPRLPKLKCLEIARKSDFSIEQNVLKMEQIYENAILY